MSKSNQNEEELSFKNYFTPFTNTKALHYLVTIGLLIYFISIFNGFISDDRLQIVDNPVIRSLDNVSIFFKGGTFYNGNPQQLEGVYYRPLVPTYFALIYSIFGLNSSAYHIVQLIFFISNACLVYLIFNKFFNKKIAFISALFFLVHPINSETALYISDSQDVFYLFFGLLSIFILQRYSSYKALSIASLCILFSILFKETGFLFIIITFLFIFFFKKKYFLYWLGYTLLNVLIYSLLRISALGLAGKMTAHTPIGLLHPDERIFNMPSIILYYLKTLIFPVNLSISWRWAYTTFDQYNFLYPLIIVSLFFISISTLGLYIYKKAYKKYLTLYIFFSIWFLIGLAINLHVIPLDATVADRWFYFPFVGLLGILAILCEVLQIKFKNVFILITLCLIISLLSGKTFTRSFDYKNDLTISSHDILNSKEAYDLENNLSAQYYKQGNMKLALLHAERSVKIFPNVVNYTNLGGVYFRLGRYKEAKEVLIKATQYGNYQLTYYNLVTLALFYGDPKENIDFIKNNVLTKYPQDGITWMVLGVLEYNDGNKENAKEAISKAYNLSQAPLISHIYKQLINDQPLNLSFNNGQITILDK